MAIARLSVKVGKAGKAAPHAEYIDRDEEKKKKEEQAKTDLEHSDYGNMPKWAEHNPITFWQSADLYERKNGSTYREYEIALPREMNQEQRLELVQDFIQSEIGSKYPYQFAIHNPKAMDGNDQPHVHLMFNERLQDGIERDPEQYFKRYNGKNPERGGAKKDNTGKSYQERKTDIKDLRQRWADLCNSHLEKHQIDSRIDMRSYKEQGIEKEPEKKLLPSQAKNPEVREALQQLRTAYKEVERLDIDREPEVEPSQPRKLKEAINADTVSKMDIEKRLETFFSTANDIAKRVQANEIGKIKDKNTQIIDQLKELEKSEPMFFKKKWQQEKDALVKEYESNTKNLDKPFKDYLSYVQHILKKEDAWKNIDIDGDVQKVERKNRELFFERQVEARQKERPISMKQDKEKDMGDDFEM